jgi:hypothetical protein
LVAAAGIPLLTLLLAQLRESTGLPTVLLAYLALVVVVSVVGGTWPGLVAAVAAFLCANWFFTPPTSTWTVAEAENVVALFVFLGIALGVSRIVDTAARRAAEAARARGHARTLARLAASTGDDDPVPALLESLRATFALDSVAVFRRDDDALTLVAAAGEARGVEHADIVRELTPGVVLAIGGPSVGAEDQLVPTPLPINSPSCWSTAGCASRRGGRRRSPMPTSYVARCCRRSLTIYARHWPRSRRAPRA